MRAAIGRAAMMAVAAALVSLSASGSLWAMEVAQPALESTTDELVARLDQYAGGQKSQAEFREYLSQLTAGAHLVAVTSHCEIGERENQVLGQTYYDLWVRSVLALGTTDTDAGARALLSLVDGTQDAMDLDWIAQALALSPESARGALDSFSRSHPEDARQLLQEVERHVREHTALRTLRRTAIGVAVTNTSPMVTDHVLAFFRADFREDDFQRVANHCHYRSRLSFRQASAYREMWQDCLDALSRLADEESVAYLIRLYDSSRFDGESMVLIGGAIEKVGAKALAQLRQYRPRRRGELDALINSIEAATNAGTPSRR